MLDFLRFWNNSADDNSTDGKHNPIKSFSAPDNIDGAIEVQASLSGPQTNGLDHIGGIVTGDRPKVKDMIRTYRSLANYHEVDDAIQDIVDEAIVYEDGKEVAWLNMDGTSFSDNIKKKIDDEFDKVMTLLKMRKNGHKWFRKWYVDSRIYFHKIVDKKGNIIELRPLDPTKLELVRVLRDETQEGIKVIVGYDEFYKYSPHSGDESLSWQSMSSAELRIPKEAIVFAHSGLTDGGSDHTFIIGHLQRAIKPANQLKMLEDALVIYRLARAPERRVFYVDVGNLPTQKAQQYVNNIIQSVKNRLIYDTSTGSVKNSTNAMSMLEDYYLPRREGGKGTEVSTLPGGSSLGEIDDVKYFNRKLYKAMNLPMSRADAEDGSGGMSFGGGGEITRDELKFTKFVRRLQSRFDQIILEPLKHQLIINKIITEEEWKAELEKINVVFNKDSYFEEAKDLELLGSRMNALRDLSDYVGKYYSNSYVMKDVLRLSDDQIEQISKEILTEKNDPQFQQTDNGF